MLQDGFEASAVAASKRYHKYVNINSRGVELYFAMSLAFPLLGLLLCSCYMKGARLSIRRYMHNPQHFSIISSLFWIGQSFTILVIVLDSRAINEDRATHMFMKELESYQLIIVGLNLGVLPVYSLE